MKSKLLLGLAVSGLSLSSMADSHPAAEIYLGAAQYFWDSDRNLDDSTAIELGAELPVSADLSFEAWVNDFDAEPENAGAELDGRRYSIGGLYHLMAGDYRPFVALGASHQEFEAGALDSDESLLYAGVGAKKYFDNNLILRGDVFAMNSLDNELTDLGLRIAVGYAFGRAATSQTELVPAPPARQDSKAQQAEPAQADTAASKTAAPESAPQQTPQQTRQQVMDADRDGVADALDQCPDTDVAFKVDANGCPIKLVKPVSMELHVKFKTNSAEVEQDSLGDVKALAEFLGKFADTRVVVEGHTDSQGSAAYNKALSQKRADAVRGLLIEQYGVDGERVSAKGMGEEQPIASNDTAEGRAKNRRVVALVEASEEGYHTR